MRAWMLIHRWTSLVCTVFLLFLCITGLPLIFHDEIKAMSRGYTTEPLAEGEPRANLDAILKAAQALHPDMVTQFAFVDDEDPGAVRITLGKTADDEGSSTMVVFDARTALVLDEPPLGQGVMYVLLMLHAELFLGLGGKLWLGAMGLLLVVSIASGVVVYAPYMRKIDFGTIRSRRARLRFLDLHNLWSIVLAAWMLVVGATGIINTWADLALKAWQVGELTELTLPFQGQSPVSTQTQSSLQNAVTVASEALPGMRFSMVAFPGTAFSTDHHFAVFMRGATPVTARLLRPALVDAQTGVLAATRPLPWYVTAVLVAQPLHFGDYGGLPLKILWALMDLLTIGVLLTGIYLWYLRRRGIRSSGIAEEVRSAS